MNEQEALVLTFDEIGRDDGSLVGGKNASLGEMIRNLKAEGVRVPPGFATTAKAYRSFLSENDLEPRIREALSRLEGSETDLASVGESVRSAILESAFPEAVEAAIREGYADLCRSEARESAAVAVRSSATAEDLPGASFAGQQETFLNVRGSEALLEACRKCFASLFTDRAISYRRRNGFDHLEVALSVGVQTMVRSDKAGAGVMFTLDTETGFPDVVIVNAAHGLGESVVQGTVIPDEYRVFKPLLGRSDLRPVLEREAGSKETKIVYAEEGGTREVETPPAERSRFVLSEEEALRLSRWAVRIEEHYGTPMDIEWAKDGETGDLFVVQARPETVQSRRKASSRTVYTLKERGEVLAEGLAVGDAVASGEASVRTDLASPEGFKRGSILVTEMTDPDWVPLMKRAGAVVTEHGGRTSHAAIVSRELGVPAVVGAEDATKTLADAGSVTVSCAEGETGFVYRGSLPFEEEPIEAGEAPETKTAVMMNLASPEGAFRWWALPSDGIGLARMEFIVNNAIRVHPLALLRFDEVEDEEARERIERITGGREDKGGFFVERLARGLAKIAASVHPRPCIVRFSDFKTNEYAGLIGGRGFEPAEENPMLGFRGASRYTSERYRDAFALECRAVKTAREEIGLENIKAMVPFCRTLEEADGVLEALSRNGLERGKGGFEVYVMAEIPSNVVLARAFAQRFDGFSIGSNDLTQLTLGVDRDAEVLSHLFSEKNPAVKDLIRRLIEEAHAEETPVGLCGQAPSDDPDFARFLVEAEIDSISVEPDSLAAVREKVAEAEAGRGGARKAGKRKTERRF